MGYTVVEMATSDSPAATMKLVGGDLCLDFVNTVGGRAFSGGSSAGSQVLADKLAVYADLVAWGRHTESVDEAAARRLARLAEARPREAAAVLSRVLAFREALYRTLRSLMLGRRPEAPDLSLLNTEIAAGRGREALRPARDGLRWAWPDPGGRLDALLWPVGRAAAALLTSPGELSRLRQCGGDTCGWLFLDRSRNRSRQWCTMEDCGNVSKVRRFRQRHARRVRPHGRADLPVKL